jgi:uncharacterized sporulation protein YeaH/YhbH (DUF444 family)
VLLEQIIRARYPAQDWNIYVAQASDGDNGDDSAICRKLLADKILPLVRYYAYVQVAPEEQNLWQQYSQLPPLFPGSPCARWTRPARSTRCSASCSRRRGCS